MQAASAVEIRQRIVFVEIVFALRYVFMKYSNCTVLIRTHVRIAYSAVCAAVSDSASSEGGVYTERFAGLVNAMGLRRV
jgi:hypothetical protein